VMNGWENELRSVPLSLSLENNHIFVQQNFTLIKRNPNYTTRSDLSQKIQERDLGVQHDVQINALKNILPACSASTQQQLCFFLNLP